MLTTIESSPDASKGIFREIQTRTTKQEGVKNHMSALSNPLEPACGQTCTPRDYQDLASQNTLRDSADPGLWWCKWMLEFLGVDGCDYQKTECVWLSRRNPLLGWAIFHGSVPAFFWDVTFLRPLQPRHSLPCGKHKCMEDPPRTVFLEPHDMKTRTL